MTKPVTRKMAVDCLLNRFLQDCVTSFCGIETSGHAFLICSMCGNPIRAGHDIEFDHIHADVFDGPHEYQNLRPLHKACHKKKTARDVKANAKIKRLTGKTKGRPKRDWPRGPKMKSRPFRKRKKP